MELDDFKQKEWPTERKGQASEQDVISDQLIEKFHSEIRTEWKKTILWIAILGMLSIHFLSLRARTADLVSLGGSFIAAGFILGAVYLYLKYRPLTPPLYRLPMAEFLSTAEKRLRYMNASDLLIVVPLLLLLRTGGGMVFITRLSHYTDHGNMLLSIWIIFFILLSLFGFYAGKKNWLKVHGALLQGICNIKDSIRKEEA